MQNIKKRIYLRFLLWFRGYMLRSVEQYRNAWSEALSTFWEIDKEIDLLRGELKNV